MRERKLTSLNVAVMYIGAIMGAGFASGRETWQFFGVFGDKGKIGALIFALIFMVVGQVVSYIARKLQTNDMGSIIVPGNNEKLRAAVGYLMAFSLATVMVIMTAAGGALVHQQFGLNYAIGGALITILVVATVLGDFERVSKVFGYIMPVLCVAMVGTCIAVIAMSKEPSTSVVSVDSSPVASNWMLAAILYTAYNVMALIAIVATATIKADNKKTAIIGNTMGGVFLGMLAMLILITVQCDPAFSEAMDMPVLGYAGKISNIMGILYTIILFFAIYSAATSNFYGFTTKIKNGPNKNKIIVGAAALAFLLGLVGFKNIIKYLSPIMGYVGIVIVIMIFCNFIRIRRASMEVMNVGPFPEPLVKVTGGPGGDAVLIIGKEKTVLHDCGMACFSQELIENIEHALGERTLDYVILSHTHYDHIGALPYVIRRWPNVTVCGGKKAAEIFNRQSAVDMIFSMGKTGAEHYGRDPEQVVVDGLRIDKILDNGDILDLGEEKLLAFETKGHTDCSISYLLKPQGVILASESTGVISRDGKLRTSVLKSFEDSLEAATFLKLMPFEYILVPHYGILSKEFNDKYFDIYIETAEKERDMIKGFIEKGLSLDEIFQEHQKAYWNPEREKDQPFRAYKMNTEIIIKRIMKEAGAL